MNILFYKEFSNRIICQNVLLKIIEEVPGTLRTSNLHTCIYYTLPSCIQRMCDVDLHVVVVVAAIVIVARKGGSKQILRTTTCDVSKIALLGIVKSQEKIFLGLS